MNNTTKTILTYLPLTLLIVAIIGGALIFFQYQQTQATLKKQQQAQPQTPLEAVSRLMELPKDETPVVNTITDKTQINKNPLFKDVENNDIVIVYPKKQQAIVYRASTNKIIAVGPVQINQPSGTVTPPVVNAPTR